MARTRRAPETRTAPVDGGLAELRADPDRERAWTLLVDSAPQSHVDLADPAYLGFSYQRRLGHVVDLVAPAGRPLQVVHLGGGALTLARYTAHTRPRSTQTVIELDTALTELVRRELPWDRGWRIKVRGGDARDGLAKLPDASADLVIADAFAGARTPAHLATLEFLHEVRRVLRPDGHYAVNLTDGGPLTFARGQSATVRAAFPEAVLAAEPAVLRGKRFGNLMLWAAAQPLPLAAFGRLLATDPHQSRITHGPDLAAFTAGAPAVTDATATASPEPPDHAFD
ncbi:spermidine synthase [Streptomyces polygonati]|uniref:Spermidine synthase n=1 Tax=Streptomyces polygonati TaxID=1617087 RepID=A0ABV8HZD7_9ACTN